jgi:hypothetical protein
MKANFKELLEKAVDAKALCDGPSEFFKIEINDDWKITVYAHPSEEKLHKVVGALISLTGKLEKRQEAWGTGMHFFGANDDFDVQVVTPEKCKIVGYKIEKRPKKVTVETAEMETVKTPVTDCDFRAGKVKSGEFEPVKEEAIA